jgi:hypothetical protein
MLKQYLIKTKLATAILLVITAASVQADNDFDQTIENALKFNQADGKYGQIKFDLRFRYENVDTSPAFPATANAATMRLRLGYLTPGFYGLQAYAEYEGNQDIVANDYNSTRNGKTGYLIIADPQQNELNQLWLSYKGLPNTEIKVGRQRIELDNQRFIGSVDWRQMQQTYDGLLITNTSLPDTTIKAGYILKVQNINSAIKDVQMPFANLSYNFKDVGTLTGYAYLMDFNEPIGTAFGMTHGDSNQTYGVRFDGSRKITEDIKGHYLVEYAHQMEYVQNPTEYDADYYHIVGGLTAFGITAKAGMEQLDSGGGAGGAAPGTNRAFKTPLALLHAFNGWADQFISTPDNGLRDVYGLLTSEIMGVKLTGAYHEYSSDTGKYDYGSEWNFLATREFAKHYTLLAKYAFYNAGNSAINVNNRPSQLGTFDTQKFWIGASVSF